MTGLDDDSARRVEALVDVFRRADGRMAGLPLYRAGLTVEGRGFQPFDGLIVGVLVTPWCMNVILLPGPDSRWEVLPQGTEVDHVLPCGTVRFVTARDAAAGDYRMCSLFSPMFDFAGMEAARATADAALVEVLTSSVAEASPLPSPPSRPVSRRDLFRRLGA